MEMFPEYTALIRTFNSERTLPATLTSLFNQSRPPNRFVFVDSGSTDGTLQHIPPGSQVHHYGGVEFNYAEALNQGLKLVSTEYVLIISSHTRLLNPGAIEYGLKLLRNSREVGAAYCSLDQAPALTHRVIDKAEFDGFNGLFSTCGLVRMELLRERAFRPEVFTAEDQEWSKWLIFTKGMVTARIAGAGTSYENPRGNSIRKRLNEYVAVAYYTNPKLLSCYDILRIATHVVRPKFNQPGNSLRDRLFYFLLIFRLVKCRFSKPQESSRYF
jgi:glycosyltransferase involved in cell wall biosynthesis